MIDRIVCALASIALLMSAPPAFAEDAAPQPRRLTLEESVALALENNTNLSIVRREKERALQQKHEALGMAMPDLDVTAQYRYEGINPEVEIFGETFKLRPDESYSFSARLNQYVYSGAVSSGYRAAKLFLRQAGSNERASRNDVIANVMIRFNRVLYVRGLIGVNEESVAQLRKHLDDSKKREAVGLNTRYDTMRFETRLAEAIPDLIAARNEHDRAALDLLDTLGLDPLGEAVFDGALEYRPAAVTLAEAVQSARANRPELVAAAEGVRASSEIVKAARSESLPSVKAFANYNLLNYPGFGEETTWTDEWYMGVELEMNIFDGRERASRVRQFQVDHDLARLRKEKLARTILIEVKTAFDELLRAEEFVASQRTSVGFAEETYRIATVSHGEGVATLLELLDAQLALTRARINYRRSVFEHTVATVKLKRAMGVIDDQR